MAKLISSAVIKLVIETVLTYLKDRIELHAGVEEKIKKLEAVLNRILPVVNTADEVDLEKHKDLKPWITDFKVATKEAEGVLTEFKHRRPKRQAEDDEVHCSDSPSSKRLKNITGLVSIPSSLCNYATKFIPSTHDPLLLERLRSIQCKLEELDSRAVQFLQLVMDRKAPDVRKRETSSSSSVVERELVGRKDMLEEIISKLLVEEEHISLLPVYVDGDDGMGNTSLAQHLFNDTRVAAHFKLMMILRAESPVSYLRCLAMANSQILLVLDDIWFGQNKAQLMEDWDRLYRPLAEVRGKGSKILLASRNPAVKELPGALTITFSLHLQGLTQWSIIQLSIAIRDSGRYLIAIGRQMQISLNVEGLPLAAKAVGGILLSWGHWSKILNTEFSELSENDMMSILRLSLSYEYLPPYLHQCFAYYFNHFDVDKLVRVWVAHGYIIDQPHGVMTEDNVGKSYFHDLLSGIFTHQIVHRWDHTVMHDLMNDLARFVSKDEILWSHCSNPKATRPYLPMVTMWPSSCAILV